MKKIGGPNLISGFHIKENHEAETQSRNIHIIISGWLDWDYFIFLNFPVASQSFILNILCFDKKNNGKEAITIVILIKAAIKLNSIPPLPFEKNKKKDTI